MKFTLEDLQKLLKNRTFLISIAIVAILIVVVTAFLTASSKKEGGAVTPAPSKPIQDDEYNPDETPPGTLASAFKVVRVEPFQNQTGISTVPTINIYFDKEIKPYDFNIVIKPKASFSFEVIQGRTAFQLILKSNLKPSTKYTVEVFEIDTKNRFNIFSWHFTTGNKLIASAGTVAKIKEKMPYKGKGFGVSYIASTDRYFVSIDKTPVDTYKRAAIDWFKAQGLTNPEKQINIVYLIGGPALPPHIMTE